MYSYLWQPIEDLPKNWAELRSEQLQVLINAWKNRVQQLQGASVLEDFKNSLRQEWLSEVDMLEYLYSNDRGTTQIILEEGIELSIPTASSEARLAELSVPSNIQGLFSFVTQQRNLSAFYIRELHQVLTRNQKSTFAQNSLSEIIEVPLEHGKWKTFVNNPKRPDGTIHEYCPPEQVESEIGRLIAMHNQHLEIGVSPEIEAAWLHHRFTQIHPFQDGNGRVARTLASLIFIRQGLFPVVITRNERQEYINASEVADTGNLTSLVNLFSRLQEKILIKGLSLRA
ncbi:MAG: Fic family protein [Nostocales cyanobacterium 94392]|nr:Fic family protein [Nostocales cyanobacterium 94392]